MKPIRTVCAVLLAFLFVAPIHAADRLDDALRAVARAGDPLETATRHGVAVRDGRLQIAAVPAAGATGELERWLEQRGARFIESARDRVQAFVTPALLAELESLPGVLVVERPIYAEIPEPSLKAAPRKLGTLAVTSEGVEAMNVAPWNAEGYTGAGIRVGIIDVQFGGWDDLLGVELPPAQRTTYHAFGGANVVADEVHGTGCAEIIHDIAPDAELYLAHIRSTTDFYNALDWLASEGVDVVTMSLGWYGAGPGDGTGDMADEIQAFVSATDAVFFTSAGNERRSHWQGESTDADDNDWVEFAPGDELDSLSYTMSDGDRVSVNLVWNDWSSPSSDYSLHLYNVDGDEPVEVAVSDRAQTGQSYQTPYETISYTAAEGGRFAVAIGRVGVAGTHDMELFSLDSDLDTHVAEGSLTLPGDTDVAVAVAAVNYNSPHGYRSFSSAGPTNGPGGSFAGGTIKPDISGYDGVSTVSYGTRNFYGTSAASPHVAGAAAIVRQAEPGYDEGEVRAFLESRALDLGSAGMDNDYGWGRVFLGQSPGSTCTYAIDPTEAEVAATGGGGIIRVTTDEGCPWTTSTNADWITVAPGSGTGSGLIGYTIEANAGAERTAQIVVAGIVFSVNQAGVEVLTKTFVAGIAETEGLAQTRWKSDLAILNPGQEAADVDLVYRHGEGDEQVSLTVAPGAVIELVNVAADTFAAPDSSGAVELETAGTIIVTARTYNDTPDGTFGQFLPGVTASGGFGGEDAAVLSHLVKNDDFRTNIGFVDVGGGGAQAKIRLFDGDGDPVGSEVTQAVPAGGWAQRNRVFNVAGAGDCEGCYAMVELVGAGSVWAYASVVDEHSGDPTTIPMEVTAAAKAGDDEQSLVAGIAETDGANDTKWKSNLALLNLAGRGVTADLAYRYGDEEATSQLTLGDGELVEYANIAADLFAAPGSAGLVEVAADGPLVVTARTFNDAPTGTFGQYLPGLDVSSALTPGDAGFLSHLKSTETYRTNIGYTNYGDGECTVRTSVFDATGALAKKTWVTVPADGWIQQNRVFEAAGVSPMTIGYAIVEVVTGGCEVWAYASVVDNTSGDPTTIPVIVGAAP